MALIRPVLNSITAFPSTQVYRVIFNVIGGNQVVSNEIIIQKQSDNTQVYLNKIDNFSFFQNIPQNTLVNGITYKIRVRTYDISDAFSDWSDWLLFKCLSAPNISITNIGDGNINNQTFTFLGSYMQSESSALQSYRFILYDYNNVILQSYPEIFSQTISQEVSGILNQVTYYIELITISVDGVQTSTEKQTIVGDYIVPNMENIIELSNIVDDGKISVKIRAIQILGIGTNFTYENDDWINVLNGSVVFSDDLELISQNFSLKLWLKGIIEEIVFCIILGINGKIELKYYGGRFHAFKTSNGLVSHFASNDITFLSTETVVLEIKQINELIDLYAEKG